MIVTCPSCSARFQYDDARFEGVKSKRFRCPKCQEVFEAENPNFLRATTKSIDERLIIAALGGPQEAAPVPDPPKPPARYPTVVTRDYSDSAETTARRDREGMLQEAGIADLGIPAGMRYSLAFLTGPNASIVRALDTPKILIGREEGDIVTRDPETSRRHATLEIRKDGSVWLRDQQSTNGTFVDGMRIEEAAPLSDRQEFTCGKSTFMMLIRQDEDSHLV